VLGLADWYAAELLDSDYGGATIFRDVCDCQSTRRTIPEVVDVQNYSFYQEKRLVFEVYIGHKTCRV